MTAATSKLAQVAKGSATCQACGTNKPLKEFGVHPRWGTPYKMCGECRRGRIAAGRKAGTKRRAEERALATMMTEEREHANEDRQRKSNAMSEMYRLSHRLTGAAIIQPSLEPFATALAAIYEDLI